ncbi:hypothetical protein [Arthrobacter sp. MYb213]|uniref:hypothetical protein n=1 Tax=Arthrobacter sp. MYb213 TaxID=1848595 RepID=UPI000CFC6863|nr:hypothetical protein [Arthrobacter sp. MYb213]PRB69500.1 hypothetical protein CQ011_12115 [Arthrobacter sp. MYb213]
MSTETITVQTMGEDGDQWLVTGTTDAHSADEAVRQHVEHESGETIEALTDADELVEFAFQHRTDWAWVSIQHGEKLLVHREYSGSRIKFAGYLVSAA